MIEKTFDTLYTLDSKGKVRVFECHVLYTASGTPTISTSTGLLGGKMITKLEPVKAGKNLNKKNETNPLAQAFLMADSLWRNKLNEGYKSWVQLKAKYNSECTGLDSKFLDDDYNAAAPRVHHLLSRYPEAAQTNSDWEYLPMLATKAKDIKKYNFPYFCQPKLNGVRCMAKVHNNAIRLISRGGTYYKIPHIEEQLMMLFGGLWDKNILLDGELYKHGVNLQDISGAARTAEEGKLIASNSWLEYHIYDVINLNNPPNDETEDLREVHRLSVGIVIHTCALDKIKIVKSLKVLDEKEIEECHDQFVEEGYEGAILRDMNNPYQFNQRSKGLIKVKSFIDEEFEIIGYSVGEGNKPIGESFVFKLKNNLLGATNTFEARPTGTIAQKERWFNNIINLQGKKATVRFQERSKDGLPIQGHVRSELTEVLHIRPDGE